MAIVRRKNLKTLQRLRRGAARSSADQGLNARERAVLERMVTEPVVKQIAGLTVRYMLVKRFAGVSGKPRKVIRHASVGQSDRAVITVKSQKRKAGENAGRSTANT